MPRSTKSEVRQRVEVVLELQLLGARFPDLRKIAGEQGWNVSDSMLRKYQAKALELNRRQMEQDREKVFALHHQRRERLYAAAMEQADVPVALAVLKDSAALLHLYNVPAAPPKDTPPPTTAELEAALGRQLASIEAADLPATEKAKTVTAVADALIRARHSADIEKQVAELVERLAQIEKKGKR